uniref:Uncharacterized protein n=1 Tax=Chromera velia CCMP2878 TaxID=1169474 RepID=A0A0G4HJH0_9ALVE|eukprot:Cvel_28160.t1-p1 / transcript=Cvel_28160.t1 / gene=Cvel_28160 / organism=Chromera_velia_CCMP2878 / gene_product=hypothetical protein / transcript_product=hypothetical protein / location=Cvel_scaffold3638:475-4766(+) / protein_length=582 / sequence_SO=supercontig / SO=protein_coding / is_pseudo=false
MKKALLADFRSALEDLHAAEPLPLRLLTEDELKTKDALFEYVGNLWWLYSRRPNTNDHDIPVGLRPVFEQVWKCLENGESDMQKWEKIRKLFVKSAGETEVPPPAALDVVDPKDMWMVTLLKAINYVNRDFKQSVVFTEKGTFVPCKKCVIADRYDAKGIHIDGNQESTPPEVRTGILNEEFFAALAVKLVKDDQMLEEDSRGTRQDGVPRGVPNYVIPFFEIKIRFADRIKVSFKRRDVEREDKGSLVHVTRGAFALIAPGTPNPDKRGGLLLQARRLSTLVSNEVPPYPNGRPVILISKEGESRDVLLDACEALLGCVGAQMSASSNTQAARDTQPRITHARNRLTQVIRAAFDNFNLNPWSSFGLADADRSHPAAVAVRRMRTEGEAGVPGGVSSSDSSASGDKRVVGGSVADAGSKKPKTGEESGSAPSGTHAAAAADAAPISPASASSGAPPLVLRLADLGGAFMATAGDEGASSPREGGSVHSKPSSRALREAPALTIADRSLQDEKSASEENQRSANDRETSEATSKGSWAGDKGDFLIPWGTRSQPERKRPVTFSEVIRQTDEEVQTCRLGTTG